MDISSSFYKGRKGWDTVADEMVSLTQNVQVHLGQVLLKAYHFHLKSKKAHYFTLKTLL